MNEDKEQIKNAILIRDIKKIINDYKSNQHVMTILLGYLDSFSELENIDLVSENYKLKTIIDIKNNYIKDLLVQLKFNEDNIKYLLDRTIISKEGKAFDYDGALESYNKREKELMNI